jgi:hypothetical protein
VVVALRVLDAFWPKKNMMNSESSVVS